MESTQKNSVSATDSDSTATGTDSDSNATDSSNGTDDLNNTNGSNGSDDSNDSNGSDDSNSSVVETTYSWNELNRVCSLSTVTDGGEPVITNVEAADCCNAANSGTVDEQTNLLMACEDTNMTVFFWDGSICT